MDVSMPHAADGRLQLLIETRKELLAARFNAARGKWSVATAINDLLGTYRSEFQCRTRQVVGYNLK